MLSFKAFPVLALLQLASCHPQMMNLCSNAYTRYETESTKDVSEWKFWGTSDDICQAPCELASTETDGVSIAWSWTVGGEGSIKDAIGFGLSFGMEVSTYEEKGTVRNLQCAGAEDNEDGECRCGLIYKIHMQEASGKKVTYWSDSCDIDEQKEDFTIQAPTKENGRTTIEWEQCKSSLSKNCPEFDKYQPCPGGK